MRNCQTVSHSACTILHSHQYYMRVPFYPHPIQYLLFSFYKNIIIIMAILIVKWGLIVVSICIPWLLTILSIFSHYCWPFVYLPWRNMCSSYWSLLKLGCLSFLFLTCVIMNFMCQVGKATEPSCLVKQ